MKKWLVILLVCITIAVLYWIEFSKIESGGNTDMPTLDDIEANEAASAWEPFYKVRATLIDWKSADFSIPDELKEKEGKMIKLTGAPVFFGNGCEAVGEKVKVKQLVLVPSQGIAKSCEINPSMSMRYTILVSLSEPMTLERNDMIDCDVTVAGIFRIDTSKPYEAAFFIDNAKMHLLKNTSAQVN